MGAVSGYTNGKLGLEAVRILEPEVAKAIVVAATYNRGREIYAAARGLDGVIHGYVILVEPCGNGDAWVKYMDEGMGPYRYDAPAKVLDALSPTTDPTALEWRAACRARIAKKQTVPKFKVGQRVQLKVDVEMQGGWHLLKGKVGTVEAIGPKRLVVSIDHMRCRLLKTSVEAVEDGSNTQPQG